MEITVRKGQTLSGLARQHGTTWQKLAQANGISDPKKLQIGQTLTVPDQFSAPASRTPAGAGRQLQRRYHGHHAC